jgi:hypothetical protein
MLKPATDAVERKREWSHQYKHQEFILKKSRFDMAMAKDHSDHAIEVEKIRANTAIEEMRISADKEIEVAKIRTEAEKIALAHKRDQEREAHEEKMMLYRVQLMKLEQGRVEGGSASHASTSATTLDTLSFDNIMSS